MSILDVERDRLKKHYLELEDNYEVLKGQTEEALVELTKTEFYIMKKFADFVALYTKIDCSPDFYDMDGFDSKKVKIDLKELRDESNRAITISQYIKEKDEYEYAAISILGMKKLLNKADELEIGHGSKIKHEALDSLKNYLREVGVSSIELDREDEKLKIDLRDDQKMLDFEKRMHAAIKELKDFTHKLEAIKNITKKYTAKIKYLDEMYENHRTIVDEIVDFNGIKHWKELDKDQDALMSVHSNVILAQALHDMCNKGLLTDDGKDIDYKNFEKLLTRAGEVIDVIDVYTKVNVF